GIHRKGVPMEAATPASAVEEVPRRPGAGSYIVAILFPIVGAILAIIQFARSNTGPGFALLLTSAVSFFVWFLILLSMAANDAWSSLNAYVQCIQHAQTLNQMSNC